MCVGLLVRASGFEPSFCVQHLMVGISQSGPLVSVVSGSLVCARSTEGQGPKFRWSAERSFQGTVPKGLG